MKLRKNDILLITGFLLAALLLWLAVMLLRVPGARVQVIQDGAVTAEYPLDRALDIVITGEGGTNRLVIEAGAAQIVEADCPDGICMHRGAIRYDGETIVCLPHGLILLVKDGEAGPLDAVAE